MSVQFYVNGKEVSNTHNGAFNILDAYVKRLSIFEHGSKYTPEECAAGLANLTEALLADTTVFSTGWGGKELWTEELKEAFKKWITKTPNKQLPKQLGQLSCSLVITTKGWYRDCEQLSSWSAVIEALATGAKEGSDGLVAG